MAPRSTKTGYRINLVRLRGGHAASSEESAEGWLDGEWTSSRPADLLQLPGVSLPVSDDHAGAIYRISYEAGK